VRYKEGTDEPSGRSGFPGAPGESQMAIQLPPLSPLSAGPHAVSPPVAREGGRRLRAYSARVEGPDPVGRADKRRMPRGGFLQESSIGYGEPPTVHRLQPCRVPNGPRASVAVVPVRYYGSRSPSVLAVGASLRTHQPQKGDRSGMEEKKRVAPVVRRLGPSPLSTRRHEQARQELLEIGWDRPRWTQSV